MSSSSAGGKKQLKKVLGRLDAEEKALLESARNRIIPETVSKQYQETHIMYQDKAKIEALEQRMESDEIDSALVRMSSSRRLSRKKFDTTVRPYLALLLEYFKCPDAWSDPDDVLDPLIETLEDIDADWLILTQEETCHLHALKYLYDTHFDDMTQIFDDLILKFGREESFEWYISELARDVPGRGILAYGASRLLIPHEGNNAGKQLEVAPWATLPRLTRFCEAMAGVLKDPRGDEETNGWIYDVIFHLAVNARWSSVLMETLREPMRGASVREQVDTDMVGTFDDVLFYLCRSQARWTFIETNRLPESAVNVDYFDDVFFVYDSTNEVLIQESTLYLELFAQESKLNRTEIPFNEYEMKPIKNVNYEAGKGMYLSLMSAMKAANESFAKADFAAAMTSASRAKELVEWLHGVHCVVGMRRRLDILEKEIPLLCGHCLLELKHPRDALAQFRKAAQYIDFQKLDQKKFIDKYDGLGVLGYIKALIQADKRDEADVVAKKALLFERSPTTMPSPCDDFSLEDFRCELRQLREEVKDAAKGGSVVAPKSVLGLVVKAQPPVPIKHLVERATWKPVTIPFSKPPVEGVVIDMNTMVDIIPRLKWALMWVKKRMLIWNFQTNKIVHWLSVDGDNDLQMKHVVVDLVEHGVLFFSCVRSDDFPVVVNMCALQADGGESSFQAETIKYFGRDMQGEARWDSVWTLLADAWVFGHDSRGPNGTGDWTIGVSYHRHSRPQLGVYVYTNIPPGSRYGPLNIGAQGPAYHIPHDVMSFVVYFVPSSTFVVTAGKQGRTHELAVWDYSQPIQSSTSYAGKVSDIPAYVHQTNIASSKRTLFLVFSDQDMFGSLPKSSPGGRNSESFDTKEISVWSIPDATRLGTLMAASIVKEIIVAARSMGVPCDEYYLYAAHSDGSITVWGFKDSNFSASIVHLHTYKVVEKPDYAPCLSLYRNQALALLVANMEGLTVMWLEKHPSDASALKGVIHDKPEARNCAACSVFVHSPENGKCAGCKKVFYCGKSCQKAHWASHKKLCQSAAQATST